MDTTLFFALFLVLGVLYFIVGYIVSRSVRSVEDYFLAGRKLNLFQITISLIATQLGGGFLLGTSKEAYSIGYYGLLYVMGICIGFMLLASGIAARLRSLEIETTAQLFEVYYGSPFLRKVASLCSIVSLGGVFAAQVLGSRTLLVSLDVYNPIIFTLFWALVILYAMLGGLRAIVQNDIFQLTLIIIVFVGLFVTDVFSNPHYLWDIAFFKSDLFKLSDSSELTRLMVIPLMPALYSLIEQDLAQVFFAARNSRLAVLAAGTAGISLLLFAFVPLYFGMKARLLGIPVSETASPLISLFDQTYPSFVVAFVVFGVLAAIISTANAILCAISSNIVQDFELPVLDKRHQLLISKGVMLAVGCIGWLLAFQLTDLIKVLVDSYAVPVTGLLVPLLVTYYASRTSWWVSRQAAYLSVFAGLGTFFGLLMFSKSLIASAEIDGLIASVLGYGVGLLLPRKI
jgi:solute:Na+ symporter, SSS family